MGKSILIGLAGSMIAIAIALGISMLAEPINAQTATPSPTTTVTPTTTLPAGAPRTGF